MQKLDLSNPKFKSEKFKEFLKSIKEFYPRESAEDLQKVYYYLNKNEEFANAE